MARKKVSWEGPGPPYPPKKRGKKIKRKKVVERTEERENNFVGLKLGKTKRWAPGGLL